MFTSVTGNSYPPVYHDKERRAVNGGVARAKTYALVVNQ